MLRGNPIIEITTKEEVMKKRPCNTEECSRNSFARGKCKICYLREYRKKMKLGGKLYYKDTKHLEEMAKERYQDAVQAYENATGKVRYIWKQRVQSTKEALELVLRSSGKNGTNLASHSAA